MRSSSRWTERAARERGGASTRAATCILASGARGEIPAAAGTLVERVVLALDGQGVGDQS